MLEKREDKRAVVDPVEGIDCLFDLLSGDFAGDHCVENHLVAIEFQVGTLAELLLEIPHLLLIGIVEDLSPVFVGEGEGGGVFGAISVGRDKITK